MSKYFTLLKFNKNHPQNKNKKNLFEIWESYDDQIIWGSPLYEIIEYFDTRKQAQNFLKTITK